MAPDALRLFFRAAIFIAGTALVLLFFVPRESAEFVAVVLSLIIGLILLVLVLLVNWWMRR